MKVLASPRPAPGSTDLHCADAEHGPTSTVICYARWASTPLECVLSAQEQTQPNSSMLAPLRVPHPPDTCSRTASWVM